MHMYALKHTCMQMYAYMYAFFTRTLPVARVVLGCLPVLPGMTAVPGLSIQQEARRRACGPITISHDHAHRIDCQPWNKVGAKASELTEFLMKRLRIREGAELQSNFYPKLEL